MPVPSHALADDAASQLGGDAVRTASADDAIDGIAPQVIVEPSTEDGVATALAWASDRSIRVVVRGGGTKIAWGQPPAAVDVVLSTARLNAVAAHRHGDLTATIQAGATLAAVNRALSRQRQWLPLDPPWADRATIGGILATGDSGPRRHRYGAPRDLIIGVTLARADGRLAKAGGIVVKNVAGYDLGRLLVGSFGSLGAIVSATFKLSPVPETSATVVIDLPVETMESFVAALATEPVTPSAVELELPPSRLLVRFETIEAAVAAQIDAVARLAARHGGLTTEARGDDEARLWVAHGVRPWSRGGAVLKVSVLPDQLAGTLGWLIAAAGTQELEVVGRAGLAVLLVRLGGHTRAQERVISDLRARLPIGRGSAVLVRGDAELKRAIDVWGPIGDALPVMQAIKRQFDPRGILREIW